MTKTLSTLDVVKLKITIKNPFFGALLLQTPIETHSEDSYCTDGQKIYIPKKVNEDHQTLQFILMHELLHIALKHPLRFPLGGNKLAWNIACDAVVNSLLQKEGWEAPEEAIGIPNADELGVEYVYHKLLGKGKLPELSSGMMKENTATEESTDLRVKAAVAASQQAGRESGCAKYLADTLPEIRTPWEEILENWFKLHQQSDLTYERYNRRFIQGELYLPAETDQKCIQHLAIIVDTSGSMYELFNTCAANINKIREDIDITTTTILDVDTQVSKETVLAADDEWKPVFSGLGGTHLAPGFKRVTELEDVDLLIVMSDMELWESPSSYPRPDCDVLWITDKENVRVPWGTVLQVF